MLPYERLPTSRQKSPLDSEVGSFLSAQRWTMVGIVCFWGLVYAQQHLLGFSTWAMDHLTACSFMKDKTPFYLIPQSVGLDLIVSSTGNGGDTPNGSGGMIPSISPPFAMTRWVAQTRLNYVSMLPYNHTDTKITGFQATHQPAIWMGESFPLTISPNVLRRPSSVVPLSIEERGLPFQHSEEVSTACYYAVTMGSGDFKVKSELTSTSRVGHLRFTFPHSISSPYVSLELSRPTVITSTPTNLTYPLAGVEIHEDLQEVWSWTEERQDWILGPKTQGVGMKGYYVTKFSEPFTSYQVTTNGTAVDLTEVKGNAFPLLTTTLFFPNLSTPLVVRSASSFISYEQASSNMVSEIADGVSFEQTVQHNRQQWKDKLELIDLPLAKNKNMTRLGIWYTGFWHSLQYPYEVDEGGKYWSGYSNQLHSGRSYSGYSIWDTYRAIWPFQILFVPERIPSMITSMLQDYKESGWLPMWKNIVETNIMVGTHADSLIASAIVRNVTGFDLDLAWEAVRKDANVPPENDTTTQYGDREENVGFEVRAGLTLYKEQGFVGCDEHTEAASRTLDYAYDDYAVSVVAAAVHNHSESAFYLKRSQNYRTIFNEETGFMNARYANGSWASEDAGWTEGDKWCYTAGDANHDVPGLIKLLGGKAKFIAFLDEHFSGGHNDHTNEPSHSIPYLYTLAGSPSRTADWVRNIADNDYSLGPAGLKGNDDLGQMSAWWLFSALGFYPVNPASDEYVIGSPFFEYVTLNFPEFPNTPLTIVARGSSTKKYIKSVTLNGASIINPIIKHNQIVGGGTLVFEMSTTPTKWGVSKQE